MRILFAFAHPDDEAFGPCCTIRKLVNEGHNVIVSSMCNGARPGAEHVSSKRKAAFAESCAILGAHSMISDNPDLTMSYSEVVGYAVDLVSTVQPDVIYTNNISDINADHRLISEACMIAARPKLDSTVKDLYFCEIPGSTDWAFNQIHPQFEPNVYMNITDLIEYKARLISLYSTESYAFPDARSVESAVVLARRRGSCVGVEYAEAIKLVFSHR